MKKYISLLLIITVLVSALLPNYIFASNTTPSGTTKQTYGDVEKSRYGGVNSLLEDGTAEASGATKEVKETGNIGGAVAGILVGILSMPVFMVRALLTMVTIPDQTDVETSFKWFSVQDVVFGKIPLFDIDFLNSNSGSDANNKIKAEIAPWYQTIRLLAIILNLLVLVYVGIRMAISTIAEKKAKYKQMFVAWLVSLVLLFILHYIIVAFLKLSNIIVELISNLIPANGSLNFESKISEDLLKNMVELNGWAIVGSFISYVVITWYQLKFALLYAKRLLATTFLIIIAPLVTVTYATSKIQNGQTEAFSIWIRELAINIFIQPIHALLYMVFMFSASEIATKAPLFAAIFFLALSRGEKIIKGLLVMRGATSIHSMSESAKFFSKKPKKEE